MQLERTASRLAERMPLPDAVIKAGIRRVVKTSESRQANPNADVLFARDMLVRPIAEHAGAANVQHYELPAQFFRAFLGPRLKYSSALYPTGRESLAEAEEIALAETARHADLADGQEILELGCGWGSLTLWMAEKFPSSAITAVSNSHSQRRFIEAEADRRGLHNLIVVTADMNDFSPNGTFDRIVSVEMFEHMANWRPLLARIRSWLRFQGRLFLHVFAHKDRASRYDATDPSDWMARNFFTGGIMPSVGLVRCFADLFTVEDEWRWSGNHYRRTATHWLENFDRNRKAIAPVLAAVYGRDASLWRRRWRLFFLATAESFGFAGGESWGVSHYLLGPAA